MGLGLAIRIGDDVLDYRFDFKFRKVTVYQVKLSGKDRKNSNVTEELEKIKSMSEVNGWEWKY